MAEGTTQEESQAGTETQNGARGVGTAVMGVTQDAAEVMRTTAERAASRLPDAVATAQVAATETQRVLDEMPSQALQMGTTFSLGLGVGLFVSGANRLLVAVAMAPAAAMALTMFGREQQQAGAAASATSSNRRGGRGAQAE